MKVRQQIGSGAPWEASVGYSRAVRVGDRVFVAGTTASDEDGSVLAPGDVYGQTVQILRKIESALARVGASMTDVVRTRMFVTDVSTWEEVARAHGEWFGKIRPAATMVQVAALVDPAMLVEIEVDAVVASETDAD
jgi:enamine deaminase RidA (YjgF/YER057c/UK114 family)